MHTPDHTPACRESPHFCICGTTRPGTITTPGEKPQLMEPLTAKTMTAEDAASLFADGAEGNLVAAGGYSLRQDHLTFGDLPEIRVARGGIKYPSAYELLPKVRAERDTAQENARFWRRCTLWLGSAMAFSLIVDFIHFLGWI